VERPEDTESPLRPANGCRTYGHLGALACGRTGKGRAVGAIELSGTWRTSAPPDDVWAVVVDLTTWPRWWPAIDEVDLREGDPIAPTAAELTFGTPAPLRPLRIDLRVRELAPTERLVVEAVDSPITGEGLLALHEEDAGTATRFELELHVRSRWLRPVERLLANAARGGGRDRLRQAGDDLARLAGGEPRHHEL
jgi:uncharacterized protein YndB with AHSA1/START domain